MRSIIPGLMIGPGHLSRWLAAALVLFVVVAAGPHDALARHHSSHGKAKAPKAPRAGKKDKRSRHGRHHGKGAPETPEPAEAPPPPAAPPKVEAPPPAADSPEIVASLRADEGRTEFGAGHYEKALEAFTAAEDASPTPEYEFQIARCHDKLDHFSEALASYKRYLASAKPDPVDSIEAQQRVAALDAIMNPPKPPAVEEEPPAEPVAKPARKKVTEKAAVAPSDSGPRKPILAPVLVAAAAVALGGAGAGLLLWVKSDYDHADATCSPNCKTADVDSMRLRANIGYGLVAAGGAAAVIDVVLWALRARNGSATPERHVWVSPTTNGIIAGGQF